MAHSTVKLQIPFSALMSAVKKLSLDDKRRLWEILDAEMAQTEEDAWEHSPAFQAEMREARAAYKAGDFLTIDEYDAQRRGKRQ